MAFAVPQGFSLYAVKTTGVYCRPTCSARRAKPANVEFFSNSAAAERAGYRACKRCRPDARAPASERAHLVAKLCRLLERDDEVPSLAELARHAGLSRFHTLRLFKAQTGLTPKAYAAAQREVRLRAALGREKSVTRAIYAAGYGSSTRAYEKSQRALGMKPSTYRAGGEGESLRFSIERCSLGYVMVAATARGICAISLGDEPAKLERELRSRFPKAGSLAADARFAALVRRAVQHVEDPARGAELPLDIRGTAFQARVWRALCRIPAGTTVSYSEIAKRLGSPSATRAVASACAANPIAVAIPCHRVLRTDGKFTGYRWGIERKRALLAREAVTSGRSRSRSST